MYVYRHVCFMYVEVTVWESVEVCCVAAVVEDSFLALAF